MIRRVLLIPAAILAVFLDAFIVPSLFGNGIRPLFTLSLALAATAATCVQDGMLIAFFGGLLSDLFFNPYLGLSAAGYLIAVAILYGFIRKKGLKLFLLALEAFIAAAATEALIFGFSLVIGARFSTRTLLFGTLPSTVIEAFLTVPIAAVLRTREKKGGTIRK